LGIIWACVIGVIGGLFPAIRAARLPIATALRAT
jgi:putative ABC transport system permease protein